MTKAIESPLQMAEKWAEEMWTEAAPSWAQRSSQDYSYRRYVVEPSLSTLISGLRLNSDSLILEIGCGDGTHSLFWREQLNSIGLEKVKIVGIDILRVLISKAKENANGQKNLFFNIADIADQNTVKMIHKTFGAPDVIIAMFLLQDMPDLDSVLNNIRRCIKKDGHFIAVVVHPEFAMHLLQKGCLNRISEEYFSSECLAESGIVQWRFAGCYPIAEIDTAPIMLPYFHRHLRDYYEAFEYHGLKICDRMPLMPDSSQVKILRQKRTMPFCESKWNMYWPQIVQQPSSMLVHAIGE